MTDREEVLYRQFKPPTFVRWANIRFDIDRLPWPPEAEKAVAEVLKDAERTILLRNFRSGDGKPRFRIYDEEM